MIHSQLLGRVSAAALVAGGFALQPAAVIAQSTTGKPGPRTRAAPPKPVPKTKAAKKPKAAENTASTQADSANAEDGEEVVVTGVRNSMANARNKKMRADALVDIVDAEDMGKLPNNTIGDVIASLPGIYAEREDGEVSEIKIRGLDRVQTTIGGLPIETGTGRNASVTDLPADLVKSVEVYKTASPDMVEGSGAGSINIELRKPTDFKKGLFVALKTDQRFNTQSRKMNQTYAGTANYRINTAIGDFGIMVGATWNRNPYLESRAVNDYPIALSTRQVVGPQQLPYQVFGPRQANTNYPSGERTSPAYNAALQWSNRRNSVSLEYYQVDTKIDTYGSDLSFPVLNPGTSSGENVLPALTNIVLIPGTNRLKSVTAAPATQLGTISLLRNRLVPNTSLKLTASHRGEEFDFTTVVWRNTGAVDERVYRLRNRFVHRPTYNVDFSSDKYGIPMSVVELQGLDLLDPKEYRFFGTEEEYRGERNATLGFRHDLTLRTGGSFIPKLKFGAFFQKQDRTRFQSGRTAANLEVPLSELPEGFRDLIPVTTGFSGTPVKNAAQWLVYNKDAARSDYDELRAYLATHGFPAFGPDEGPETFSGRNVTVDRSIAAYATAYYKLKLLFPIDGFIGARASSFVTTAGRYQTVNGVRTFAIRDGSNFNIEPTVTANIHFLPHLVAKLSWTKGIKRPSINQLSPSETYNDTTNPPTATVGNPDLRPESFVKYDAVLLYDFGKVGEISINPFYWKTRDTFANYTVRDTIDSIGYNVTRPYNSGNGYRRGVEFNATSFFTFLPGILKNFGASVNYTYVEGKLEFTAVDGALGNPPATLPLAKIPKHYFNVIGLFERGTLNGRISFNYTGKMLEDRESATLLDFQPYVLPRTWMDAAINYSIPRGPLRNLGFSVQATNLMASTKRSFWGYYDTPRQVLYYARTIGGSVRYKF